MRLSSTKKFDPDDSRHRRYRHRRRRRRRRYHRRYHRRRRAHFFPPYFLPRPVYGLLCCLTDADSRVTTLHAVAAVAAGYLVLDLVFRMSMMAVAAAV